MAYSVRLIPEAAKDFAELDKSIQIQIAGKIEKLSNNPLLGDPLGHKYGIDLTGFYKLYAIKKKYRIVYHLIGETIELIEIVGIGKRDKEEIYRILAKRAKGVSKATGRTNMFIFTSRYSDKDIAKVIFVIAFSRH